VVEVVVQVQQGKELAELVVAELQEIHLERLELQILVVVEVDHILLHTLVALVVLVW
tara:strand:+ start:387 stop:557 length:171 start_codon:yes stop_codon:yes gene_type:complete